ncbi:TspO/MBR-related protein [Tothia fuscella]|uniref:TspO/MBR-related protein n=1 Tax=Tothia fuscella TaxID=1048955 RepID=A0A9P4TWC7_9PEZI|nr:TspO/MBR-related protein [Tothia fuscella]
MELKQPPYNPPAYVFAPVWGALYAAMGYASYRAWAAASQATDVQTVMDAKHGATLYTIQLGLNLIWMPLFFGFQRPIEATADIVALLGINGYLAYVWSGVDSVASWALIPYLGWLGFAAYLSAGCGYLNDWDFKKNKGRKVE